MGCRFACFSRSVSHGQFVEANINNTKLKEGKCNFQEFKLTGGAIELPAIIWETMFTIGIPRKNFIRMDLETLSIQAFAFDEDESFLHINIENYYDQYMNTLGCSTN